MFERIVHADQYLFQWINCHHCTIADYLLWSISQHWAWAIVLVIITVCFFLQQGFNRWWMLFAGVVLCFIIADQGSVLIKNIVCRPRPCHQLAEVRMFQTNCGGAYGFVSSHAANVFSIITFILASFRCQCTKMQRFTTIAILSFWAVAMCYSRVYLGKHYPADVFCGALLGITIGLFVCWIEKKVIIFSKKMKQKK